MDRDIRLIIQEMDGLAIAGAPMQTNVGDFDSGSILAGIGGSEHDSGEGYTSEEYRLAKAYIDSIGDPERARDIIDKCIDCIESLDIVDDESAIDIIGRQMSETL